MTDRRLVVLLHADVAGSTTLVHANEATAHARMTEVFAHLRACIERYGGIVHEVRGDALVAEVPRASDALSAALSFQHANVRTNEQLKDDVIPRVRIGIALGEVVIADGTVTGPGIVLAQRVEQYAEPDGVSVTAAIREATPSRLPFDFSNLGEQHAKGFEEPVHMFQVTLTEGEQAPAPVAQPRESSSAKRKPGRRWVLATTVVLVIALIGGAWTWRTTTAVAPAAVADMKFPLPDRPSVAVLPFENQAENEDRNSLADALTEDLISSLAQISGLFVISRSSSFAYKNKAASIKKVAEDLGVRYVVEGGVRQSEDQVRVTIRLMDALTGHQVWADRFDRSLDSMFELQDELTRTIATELAVPLSWDRGQRQTKSVEAHLLWRTAHRDTLLISEGALQHARRLAIRALQLDPHYVRAKALLAFTKTQMAFFRYSAEPQQRFQEALKLATEAVEQAPHDWYAQTALAQSLMNLGKFGEAAEAFEYAASLDPSNARVLAFSALPRIFNGEPEAAIVNLELSTRMNPFHTWHQPQFMGMALYLQGKYEEAQVQLEQSWERNPKFIGNWLWRAATYGQLGKHAEAEQVVSEILAAKPKFKISTSFIKFGHEVPKKQFEEGLRLAGIPE